MYKFVPTFGKVTLDNYRKFKCAHMRFILWNGTCTMCLLWKYIWFELHMFPFQMQLLKSPIIVHQMGVGMLVAMGPLEMVEFIFH